MHGQWLGLIQGTNAGLLLVDLDDEGQEVVGQATFFDHAKMPGALAELSFARGQTHYHVSGPLRPLSPAGGELLNAEDLARDFPDYQVPSKFDATLRVAGENLEITWSTDIGTSGQSVLVRTTLGPKSKLVPANPNQTWRDFIDFALNVAPGKYLYRGQSARWPLATSFHRTRRKNLTKFVTVDTNEALANLHSLTNYRFNREDPWDNGALWSLMQHHGYPTPLMDWTLSPFVAAFFAYRRANSASDEKVRIVAFDSQAWHRHFQPLMTVAYTRPHLSLARPLNIGNPRIVPQQGVFTVTNVEDVEGFVQLWEQHLKESFLTVWDLPVGEASQAMTQLRLMGIHAGSMFPGLDGNFEELRWRMFGA